MNLGLTEQPACYDAIPFRVKRKDKTIEREEKKYST